MLNQANNNLAMQGGLAGALAGMAGINANANANARPAPSNAATTPQQPLPSWLNANRPSNNTPHMPPHILVSRRQEGNPVLKHIRLLRWQFADIVPDYMVGADAAVLFLSLRFHLLKPEYVHHRLKELQRSFRLRVLLCHVDVEDAVAALATVTKVAIANECTLFCAWSPEECARYLETFKQYEHRPPDSIRERVEGDYMSKLTNALTAVRGVNKTDVVTLARTFGSVGAVMRADAAHLAACPGIGPTKVKRLHETFHQPFRRVLRPHAAGHTANGPASGEAPVATAEPTSTAEPSGGVHGSHGHAAGPGPAHQEPRADGLLEEEEVALTNELEAAVALTQAVVEVAAQARDGEEDEGGSDALEDDEFDVL